MRSKKYCSLFTIHYSLFCLLLFTFLIACGRRGDPVDIEPYKEVAVVEDLEAFIRDDGVYLTWGMPKGKNFPMNALKGFVVFRAEVTEGTTVEKCECQYRSLDFIRPNGKETFEYLDKKAVKGQTYVYKLVVMDKNNMMGRDSNLAVATGKKPEMKKIEAVQHKVAGLIAIYTQKSVVLTWDEVSGIKLYRIYRSTGISRNDFILVGETVTPVFTDKNVEPSKKYYYRVTAVKDSESPPSNVIEVITETH